MAGSSPSFSVDLGLSRTPNTNDPVLYGELLQVYNALQNLALAMDYNTGASLPTSAEMQQLLANNSVLVGRLARVYAQASETIAAGAIINLTWDGAHHRIRNANGSNGVEYRCMGFNPGGAIAAGNYAEIQLMGLCAVYGGLSVGTTYYMSPTPGLITASPPASGSHLIQPVGVAIHPNMIYFNPSLFVTRAPA